MTITIHTLTCQRCKHSWVPRQRVIKICPKCKSVRWDQPKALISTRQL